MSTNFLSKIVKYLGEKKLANNFLQSLLIMKMGKLMIVYFVVMIKSICF